MSKSDNKNKHYISASESRKIARDNTRAIKELTRRRASYKPDDYVTEMRDPGNVVEFEDLNTYFYSDNGVVKAVNGVSFEIPEGSTVGVVGESGCGKSVTSLSLMQLVQAPSGQIVSGSIRFKSQVPVRDDRGKAVPLAKTDESGAVVFSTDVTLTPRIFAPCFTLGGEYGHFVPGEDGNPTFVRDEAAPEETAPASEAADPAAENQAGVKEIELKDTPIDVESVLTELEGWVWVPSFKREKGEIVFVTDEAGNALPVLETRTEKEAAIPATKPIHVYAHKAEPVENGVKLDTSFATRSYSLPVFRRDGDGKLLTVRTATGNISPVFETEIRHGKTCVVESEHSLTSIIVYPVIVGATRDGEPLFETSGDEAAEKPLRTLFTRTVAEYGTCRVLDYVRDSSGEYMFENVDGGAVPTLIKDGDTVAHTISVVKKTVVRPEICLDPSGGRMFETERCVFDIAKMPQSAMTGIRGREIAMIFQEPMTSLNPVFTVGYQLDEVTLLHVDGATKEDAKKRSIEMLDLVGIAMPEHVYKSYPHQLSGGMRQRVMIAMALCCNPKLIIADEPTTALDVTIQAQILDLLRDVKKKISGSIMLITHDLGVIAEMVDYVVVMYAGRIVEKGTVEEIFNSPLHPYTVGLQKSKPIVGKEVDRLYSIPGNVPNPINMPSTCYFIDRCDKKCDKCRGDFPPMIKVSPTHSVACWLWNDEKQGGDAK